MCQCSIPVQGNCVANEVYRHRVQAILFVQGSHGHFSQVVPLVRTRVALIVILHKTVQLPPQIPASSQDMSLVGCDALECPQSLSATPSPK